MVFSSVCRHSHVRPWSKVTTAAREGQDDVVIDRIRNSTKHKSFHQLAIPAMMMTTNEPTGQLILTLPLSHQELRKLLFISDYIASSDSAAQYRPGVVPSYILRSNWFLENAFEGLCRRSKIRSLCLSLARPESRAKMTPSVN